MKTLYYKVKVYQHLHNYDRVEIFTVVDEPSGAEEKDRKAAELDAITKMQRKFGDDGWFTAEILEIIET